MNSWMTIARRGLCLGLVAAISAVIVGCGGGGGSAGAPALGGGGGGGTTPPAALNDLSVVLNKATVPNNGSETVTVTVTALDASRAALGEVPVSFSIDADGIVTPAGTSTDKTSGVITASASIGANRTNRTIKVTASSGAVSRTVSFDVVNPTTSAVIATDLSLLLDRTSVGNAGSEVVNVTVTAVDAQRNTVAGIPVTYTVDNGASISVTNRLTDATGRSRAQVSIGDDRSNRQITVIAESGTLRRTAAFLVTGVSIQSVPLPALPTAGSTGNRVEYRVIDINQSAMVGVPITVTGPGVSAGSGVTDSNGSYVFNYTAPAVPGNLALTATAAGKTQIQNVTVSAGSTSVPAAVAPAVLTLTATPSVVRTNSGSVTGNRSEIRALFLSPANAPVRNVRVRFDLDGDVNSVGGSVGSGTDLVYSDAQGVATTSYSPADRASPTNGVTIRACWDYQDFPTGTCPNASRVRLTVVADPISISIGTDNTVGSGASGLTYIKRYVVLVVDAAGNPKSDVQLSASVDLTHYLKGEWEYDLVDERWEQKVVAVCTNEDVNRNGVIDPGEDINGNRQLDPRKSDVSISMLGSTKTDATGTATLQIEYPKSLGSWVAFRIEAAASGVLSPPAFYKGTLPVAALEVLNKGEPSFRVSPYGVVASCVVPD